MILWDLYKYIYIYLVGGLEHEFSDFPCIGKNNPNWLSYFSEGLKPPTRYSILWMEEILHIAMENSLIIFIGITLWVFNIFNIAMEHGWARPIYK